VQYQWPQPGERWTWQQVAERARQAEQVLVIVNTRADALKALQALEDPAALHLSTSMCGVHRRVVLQEVRRRLDVKEPCRLVSTQLIEAGVDVDFPLVLRAIGPFDSITQAAGRCNREGQLPLGTTIIFDPAEGGLPPGPYRVGTGITKALLGEGPVDGADLAVYRRYFEMLYRCVNRDEPLVQEARRNLDYPEVATRFRMIGETTPIIVPYTHPEKPAQLADLLQALQSQQGQARAIVRQLQPYMVSVRAKDLKKALAQKRVIEIMPDVYLWVETYDPVSGIAIGKQGDDLP
jgi:CRISPR-associated endonuclease/helicase Cas3